MQPSPTKDSSQGYERMENADFLVEGELTVTITLREYRDLVANNARNASRKEIDEAKARWLEVVKERDALKAKVSDLCGELDRLRSGYYSTEAPHPQKE